MDTNVLEFRSLIRKILYSHTNNEILSYMNHTNSLLWEFVAGYDNGREIILDCVKSAVIQYMKECKTRLSFGFSLLNGSRNNSEKVNNAITLDYKSKYPYLIHLLGYKNAFMPKYDSAEKYLDSLFSLHVC